MRKKRNRKWRLISIKKLQHKQASLRTREYTYNFTPVDKDTLRSLYRQRKIKEICPFPFVPEFSKRRATMANYFIPSIAACTSSVMRCNNFGLLNLCHLLLRKEVKYGVRMKTQLSNSKSGFV
ncbi:hypothetical protein BT93_L3624 [Corymbia citriodora subsp. variegata]|uniref:Uncharacterized protein n=1 Tax=Corymbia citriodora subsp. variegata TaxID=360336 RepID=A0A8T0CM44_CORYI|nr:hypothetical protein BT93_L3624 [Corymbia citriodora subsp. variegata]